MKKTIQLLVYALYLVCAIYALINLSTGLYEKGGMMAVAASLFLITSVGTLYNVLSKIKSEEYKPLPKGTDFILLTIQVVALLWQSINLYIGGEITFAILLTLCTAMGVYTGYLYIKNNKK